MKVILINCLLALMLVHGVRALCLTPTRAYGECVPVRNCTFIVQQLASYSNGVPPAVASYLKALRCRNEQDLLGVNICCEGFSSSATKDESLPTNLLYNNQPRTSTARTTLAAVADSYAASLNARGVNILRELDCGDASDDKIAFGEETKLHEFPWMALLIYDAKKKFLCGGTLITQRYVLTAAHCVVDIPSKLIGVRLGEHDINSERDCQRKGRKEICSPPVEDIGIANVIPHPAYSETNLVNDMALIKLERAVEFQVHIKPICLPLTQRSLQLNSALEKEYFVAGWGTTETGSTSNVLLKAKIPHQPLNVCQNIFKRVAITHNHICAGGEGRVDSCRGDSGGPLFFLAPYARSSRFVQFGVVSFGGRQCGATNTYPGVYANVTNLMPWLTSQIDA